MLCIILLGASCYANGVKRTGNEKEMDGIPVDLKKNTGLSGLDKSNTIVASIDGHYLTVAFTENIGQVTIEVTTSTGAPVDYLSIQTPNGYLYYIPHTGDYVVTFTLSNGDEYYGEFSVTD